MAIFTKNKKELDQQVISTLISEGCVLDGNLKAPAYVRIDGHVNGDVHISEGLILGEKGSIKGNVYTKEMIVYGKIDGNLNTQVLEIKSTGTITGEIKTQVLQVEPGGTYNGKLSMTVADNGKSHKKDREREREKEEAVAA